MIKFKILSKWRENKQFIINESYEFMAIERKWIAISKKGKDDWKILFEIDSNINKTKISPINRMWLWDLFNKEKIK